MLQNKEALVTLSVKLAYEVRTFSVNFASKMR